MLARQRDGIAAGKLARHGGRVERARHSARTRAAVVRNHGAQPALANTVIRPCTGQLERFAPAAAIGSRGAACARVRYRCRGDGVSQDGARLALRSR